MTANFFASNSVYIDEEIARGSGVALTRSPPKLGELGSCWRLEFRPL